MIYAIQAGKGGSIKIGFSASPENRIRELSTGVPHAIKPLGVMEGTVQEERALHKRFYEHHVRGEWFRPAPDVLAFVRAMNPWPWPHAPEVRPKGKPVKSPRTKKQRKPRKISNPMLDRSKPASTVVNKFGGLTPFCEATGYPTSTVSGWIVNGYIPARYQRRCADERRGTSIHLHILEVAKANRIKLLPSDFVEVAHVASVSGDAAA